VISHREYFRKNDIDFGYSRQRYFVYLGSNIDFGYSHQRYFVYLGSTILTLDIITKDILFSHLEFFSKYNMTLDKVTKDILLGRTYHSQE